MKAKQEAVSRKAAWRVLRHADLLALPVLQIALLYWLAWRNAAEVIIAGGDVPYLEAYAAMFFILIRLATYLILPGIVLCRIILILLDRKRPAVDKSVS